jgi:hypothetical protein
LQDSRAQRVELSSVLRPASIERFNDADINYRLSSGYPDGSGSFDIWVIDASKALSRNVNLA